MVVSSLLNPYEEEINFKLYDEGVREIKLEQFERFFINNLKIEPFLLSLKFSGDRERVKRLLKLSTLTDDLYLKIFNLYSFSSTDISDDENRDVTLSFIERFYPKSENQNHYGVLYTPSNLIDIALTSSNLKVLEALLKFPKFEVRNRQEPWKPRELKEFLALNPNITSKIKKFLINLNDSRIDRIIALNPALDRDEQLKLLNRGDIEVKLNLARNPQLDREIFKELLKDKKVKPILLKSQKIDTKMVAEVAESDYLLISKNVAIESGVIEALYGYSKEVDFNLARNPNLTLEKIKQLYQKYGKEIIKELAKNPKTPNYLLEEFYKEGDREVILAVASNLNTPKEIIRELFNLNDREINLALAKNINLDDDIIDFFKLDIELLRAMSENEEVLNRIKSKKEYI